MSYDEFKAFLKSSANEFLNINSNETVRIISHLDSDGISAASIAIKTMSIIGRKYHISIIPMLDKRSVEEILSEKYNVFIFTDLGSGSINEIARYSNPNAKVFILDHHHPKASEQHDGIIHVNPHFFGIDGGKEISGAGVSYLFCREIDNRIKGMAHIAIIGAIGDIQENKGFLKLNNEILSDAITEHKIIVKKGIRLFGYDTKALHRMLEYCNEPNIPGVSGNEQGAINFLQQIGIYKNGNDWRTLSKLNENELDSLFAGIREKIGAKYNEENIIWNNYILPNETDDNFKEAREFSTVLNACGRLGKPSIGIGACLGHPQMKKKATECVLEYKKEILKSIEWFKQNKNTGNVIEKGNLVIINAKDKIMATIVGTISSMIAKSSLVKQGVYILSMARLIDKNTKISLRYNGKKEDINLHEIMKTLVDALGKGEYGGHKLAAGAIIPTEAEQKFIEIAQNYFEKKGLEENIN